MTESNPPSHRDLWHAIETVAVRNGLTLSGLARKSGLDATAFNVSKRFGSEGRERWPSTESLNKLLSATGVSWCEFSRILDERDFLKPTHPYRRTA